MNELNEDRLNGKVGSSSAKSKLGVVSSGITNFSTIILTFVLFLEYLFVVYGLIYDSKYVFYMDFIFGVYLWTALFIISILWIYFNRSTLLGEFFLILLNVGAGFLIYNAILRHEEYFTGMKSIFIFSYIVIGLQLIAVLLNLVNLLILIPILRRRKYKTIESWVESIGMSLKRNRGTVLALILLTALVISPLIYLVNDSHWNLIKIKITPKDYQAQFAFWAKQDPDAYTSEEKQELNKFGVTIIHFDTPYIRDPAQRANYIANIKYWRDNYPNVKIMPSIPGIPGGFVWDGSANGTTEYAKEYIELAINNNLTNIIGVAIDMEDPIESALEGTNVTDEINMTRHNEAIKIWEDFFKWRDENAPQFKVQLVNYYSNALDILDGDNDLEYLSRQNAQEIRDWDEIAPMLYRADCVGPPPFGDYPYLRPEHQCHGHYWLYYKMKLLTESINELYRNETESYRTQKLGVYLGITNCSCYGRDVYVEEHGHLEGKGYDSLVLDALIAKSFGAPIITIFILNTVIDNNNMSFGGVFDSYGGDFLEKFNQSVNGINSTRPFYIYYEPELDSDFLVPGSYEKFMWDLLMDLTRFAGLIYIIGVSLISLIFYRFFIKIKSF
ncbi:MAG: hypothetical protein ACTSU2_14455 [Promethearchaeota archaeon]